MQKSLAKKKLEHLKDMFEVIQIDTTQITSRDDKIELINRSGVLGGDMEGLSRLFSIGQSHLHENKMVNDVFKYVASVLDTLTGFLDWQDRNKLKQFELKYPVTHTLVTRGDGTFSQFEESTVALSGNYSFIYDEYHSKPLIVSVYERHSDDLYTPKLVEKLELCEDFLSLANALNEVSSDSIKTCEHCGKFFVQTTKREKLYCTTRCQNTAAVKRLRSREEY